MLQIYSHQYIDDVGIVNILTINSNYAFLFLYVFLKTNIFLFYVSLEKEKKIL